MKKNRLIRWNFIFFFMLSLISCSQNEDISNVESLKPLTLISEQEEAMELATTVEDLRKLTPEMKIQRKAAIILSDYVSLKNNQYFIDITEDEAENIGVTRELYSKITDELSQTNATIKEVLDNGDEIYLTDIKEAARTYRKGLNHVENIRTRSAQSGSMSCSGSLWGLASFYPMYGKTHVRFVCRTKSALSPIYYCRTYVFKQSNMGTAVGTMFMSTTINVPLAASGSNLCADLTFNTTDTNGGTADWFAE